MNENTDQPMSTCTCRDPYLVVGLDSGTTHSSAACSRIIKCEHHGRTSIEGPWILPKFLTALLYIPAQRSFRVLQSANETAFTKRIRYFKLRLPSEDLWEASTEEKQDLDRYIGETACIDVPDSHPANLVSAFLTDLWERALSFVEQRFPSHGNITVVLTYPSCFDRNPVASQNFHQAIAQTDFHSAAGPVLMTEHEAALRCALLDSNQRAWDCVWRAGTVVIVDCGGMTIVRRPQAKLARILGLPIRAVLNVISELFHNAHAKGVSPQVGPRPGLGPRSRYDALGRTGTDVGRKRESS